MSAKDGPLKRCSRCGKQKPYKDFAMRRASKDGLQSHCRECDYKGRTGKAAGRFPISADVEEHFEQQLREKFDQQERTGNKIR